MNNVVSNKNVKNNALDPSTLDDLIKRYEAAQQANEQERTELERQNFLFKQTKSLQALKEKLEEEKRQGRNPAHALAGTKDEVKKEFASPNFPNGPLTKDFEELLAKDAVAYEYMPKKLKDNDEFIKKCMAINPNVYSYLPLEKQQNPSIVNSYMNSRMRNSQIMEIGAGHEKALVAPKINPNVPKELAYEDQKYKKAYEYVLTHGQYTQNHVYNNQYCYMLEYQKEMGQRKAIELSQEVLRENKDLVMNVASNASRLDVIKPFPDNPNLTINARDVIDAAKKVSDLWQSEIEERQRYYWEKKESEILEIQVKKDLLPKTQKLPVTEEVELEEAKLNLDRSKFAAKEKMAFQSKLRDKAQKVLEKRLESVKKKLDKENLTAKEVADLTARKNSLISKINALSDIGAIEQDTASREISQAESLPSVIEATSAYRVIERIEDISHDHQNDPFAEYEGGAVVSNKQREEEEKEIDELLYDVGRGDYNEAKIDRICELEGFEEPEQTQEQEEEHVHERTW